MNKGNDPNSKNDAAGVVDINYPAYSAGRIIAHYISKFFKQLRSWIAAKVSAHFNRLISLRAYDQNRN